MEEVTGVMLVPERAGYCVGRRGWVLDHSFLPLLGRVLV